jgi:hypothetical protein
MRLKSELYKKEQEEICDKIIEILDLPETNTITLYELDNDKEKQEKIIELIPDNSYVDFVEYIKTNKSCFIPYNYIIEIMNSNNFEKDRQNIGMGTKLFK